LLGVFLACGVIVIYAINDDTIHSEEYILNTYEFPILGKVPDLISSGSRSYSYYYQKKPKASNTENV